LSVDDVSSGLGNICNPGSGICSWVGKFQLLIRSLPFWIDIRNWLLLHLLPQDLGTLIFLLFLPQETLLLLKAFNWMRVTIFIQLNDAEFDEMTYLLFNLRSHVGIFVMHTRLCRQLVILSHLVLDLCLLLLLKSFLLGNLSLGASPL
jgi:hypothetical protein